MTRSRPIRQARCCPDLISYKDHAWIEPIYRLLRANAVRATAIAPQGPTAVERRGSFQRTSNPYIGDTGRTFSESVCEQLGLHPNQYENAVFQRCLYRKARLLRPLLQFYNRNFFAPDRDFIRRVGKIRRREELLRELDEFYYPQKRPLAAAPVQSAHLLPEARGAGPGSYARTPRPKLRRKRPSARGRIVAPGWAQNQRRPRNCASSRTAAAAWCPRRRRRETTMRRRRGRSALGSTWPTS